MEGVPEIDAQEQLQASANATTAAIVPPAPAPAPALVTVNSTSNNTAISKAQETSNSSLKVVEASKANAIEKV